MGQLVVLEKVFVLFVLLVVGYLARKLNVFDDKVTKGLNAIIIKITLPALIIGSLQMEFTNELFVRSSKLLVLSFFVYGASFILSLIVPFILAPRKGEAGVFQYVMIFSNVAFMGYPLVQALFGDEALFYTSIYNLPFNLLSFTLGVYLLITDGVKIGKKKNVLVDVETEETQPQFEFSWNKIMNPGVIAVIIGFSLFLLRIKLPPFLYDPLKLLGDTTIPFSMFVIGAMLHNTKFNQVFGNWRVYILSLFRLLIIPVILYFAFYHYIQNKMLLGLVVIIAGMPAAASMPIISQEYGGNSEVAAEIVFISTLLSIITIPLLAFMFNM